MPVEINTVKINTVNTYEYLQISYICTSNKVYRTFTLCFLCCVLEMVGNLNIAFKKKYPISAVLMFSLFC